jgi:hypothetical protein
MRHVHDRLMAPTALLLLLVALGGSGTGVRAADNAAAGAEAGKAPALETQAVPGGKAEAAGKDAAASDGASHEEPIKQIKLSEDQVKAFIAAQADLSAISAKIQQAGNDPDAALRAELDGIAKKHGFADFRELDDVATNVAIVMAGFDAQTGQFTEPVDALRKELADVTADKSLPDKDKEQLIQELNDAIKTTPPLEHKENVDVVKSHLKEIEKALE